MRFLYLTGLRSIKLRNREALWKLNKDYPFASPPRGDMIGPSRRNRIRLVEDEVFPGAVVLDVGCNTGYIAAYLITKGCIVYGVDINPYFVEIAKSKGVFATVCPIEKITFSDNFFDVCWVSEVLEHLYNPEEGVVQLHRVLKSGGKLVGTVPSPNNKFSSRSKYQWPWHQHDFTVATLRNLLEKYFKPENILIEKHKAREDESRLFFRAVKDAKV